MYNRLPVLKKVKNKILATSIISLTLFTTLSILINQNLLVLDQFDLQVTLILQKVIPRSFDTLLSFLSLIGTFEIITILLVLALTKIKTLKNKLIVLGLYAVGSALELLQKIELIHPNPPSNFFRNNLRFFLKI